MIATGNLTYVESKDLKRKLSNYYETWNKRIEVNGEEIDNVNNYFHREHLPIRKTYFNNTLESSNTDIPKANYQRFYFDVKLIREKLIDENLIIQTNVILNKVEDYNRKIKIFKDFNNELIVILSEKDIH